MALMFDNIECFDKRANMLVGYIITKFRGTWRPKQALGFEADRILPPAGSTGMWTILKPSRRLSLKSRALYSWKYLSLHHLEAERLLNMATKTWP